MSLRAFGGAATGVAGRNVRMTLRTPSLLLPPLLAPLVFFAAFAGGLGAAAQIPGFEYPAGYTSYQFVFALYVGAVFTGMVTGLSLARDFETGFARRMMIAVADRRALLAGYFLTALARGAFVIGLLFPVGLLAGMRVEGSPPQVAGLALLALLFCVMGMLWASGVALRFRSMAGVPLMQAAVILSLFLGPAFVPLALLRGWLEAVATVNPVTRLLESGRGLLAGAPTDTALAFAVATASVALLAVWALRNLRRAEAAR